MASRLISVTLKRERGNPAPLGSSQARAFTATTIPGGKDTRPALPWELLQPSQAVLKEALTPLADDLAGRIEARADFIVAQTLGGVQHDLSPDHVTIR
jgi:hypothetical protein